MNCVLPPTFVQRTKAQANEVSPSSSLGHLDYLMADIQRSPLQRSLGEREISGKSNLDIAVHGDTDVHDSLDPTYVAKANILNDAFREIGMGRYQVSLLLDFDLRALLI
jgi:hypothetical protein